MKPARLIKVLLLLGMLAGKAAYAQQFQRNEIVAAYVYNFSKNIHWPDQSSIPEFRLLIISKNESLRKEFVKLANTRRLNGKPLNVEFAEDIDFQSDYHLVFLGHEFADSLLAVNSKLVRKNTLLVTDNFSEKRFVMINIVQKDSDDRVLYEINKDNILSHNLTMDLELIVKAGSVIDVVAMYQNSQLRLAAMEEKLGGLQGKIDSMQGRITQKEQELTKQNEISLDKEEEIQRHQKDLGSQESKLQVLMHDIQRLNLIISEKTITVAEKQARLEEKEDRIAKANDILVSLHASIDQLNRQVEEKEKALDEQGYTIASQSKMLYGLVAVVLVTISFLGLQVYWYVQKTRLNKLLTAKTIELEEANHELSNSREEIATQRDLVAYQNKELEESKHIIEEQNQEIITRNQNLEVEVAARTQELIEYNQQLEQFAFISAHNLRAPVARILGLGNLLEASGENPEPWITEKLFATTKELDRVVRDLNTILDIKKNNTAVISTVNLVDEIDMIRISLDKEIQDTKAQILTDFSMVEEVRCVRPYLDSVLINLLSNAIKYRHPARDPIIFIKTEFVSNYVHLSVQDNGLGINLSLYKEKVFRLYSRFHDHVEGRGLGLYLVKTQITAMGGRLDVESQENRGSVFHVYLKNL